MRAAESERKTVVAPEVEGEPSDEEGEEEEEGFLERIQEYLLEKEVTGEA